jgi:hypothetical protein
MYVIIAVCFVYKALNNNVDFNMEEIKGSDLHCHDTRNKQLVRLPLCRTKWGQQTLYVFLMNGIIFRHLLKIPVAF